jgi:hypothetical protein
MTDRRNRSGTQADRHGHDPRYAYITQSHEQTSRATRQAPADAAFQRTKEPRCPELGFYLNCQGRDHEGHAERACAPGGVRERAFWDVPLLRRRPLVSRDGW